MEFIPGDTLHYKLQELRAKRHWILLREAVWLVQELCLALDQAHQHNILHRDIKPANIMLKMNPSQVPSYQPVLADFGLAKLLTESGLTSRNKAMGTPNYMSPEQARGEKVDVGSDIYSLGILLYELTVGQRPFFITNLSEAVHAHTRETPPPPCMLRPDLPVQIERIILKALAKNPTDRFSDAAEMARALASTIQVASTVKSVPPSFTQSVTLVKPVPTPPDEPENTEPTEPPEIEPDEEEPLEMFRINYQFVHPYLPLNDEALVQTIVSFSSRDDIDLSQTRSIPTHLCLVLDVSGSMNTPDKYPLLREAIPHLINALSDDDYLTIILFSIGSDVILFAEPITNCRQQIDHILKRIDNSGMMFGHLTLLAPGLRQAIDEIEHFRTKIPSAVNRLYILTDGQLHDGDECYTLNGRLRTLEAEINSYGFGKNFALDTIKRITEGIPGSGKVKPIFNTKDAKAVFSHIGRVAQQIVAQDAEFTFTFASDVIPGDAFGYRPDQQYFGLVDHRAKTFKHQVGTLELNRTYTFLLEGTLLPTSQPQPAPWGQKSGGRLSQVQQKIGTALLRYRQRNRWEQVSTTITVQRTDDEWRHQWTNQPDLEIYETLDALRSSDPETQLRALRARLAIYHREGADPELVALVERAIYKLERGQTLTRVEVRGIKAHIATAPALLLGDYSE